MTTYKCEKCKHRWTYSMTEMQQLMMSNDVHKCPRCKSTEVTLVKAAGDLGDSKSTSYVKTRRMSSSGPTGGNKARFTDE